MEDWGQPNGGQDIARRQRLEGSQRVRNTFVLPPLIENGLRVQAEAAAACDRWLRDGQDAADEAARGARVRGAAEEPGPPAPAAPRPCD